eukprot:SAG31_NODE_5758_length_2341_cov_4.602141_2_plen_111_part_00
MWTSWRGGAKRLDRSRRLAAAARTEEGDEIGESVDDDDASDRRVQRFERRRTLIGDMGREVGERDDALTNKTDSEGFAIFDPRVFGMVGALVGSSTPNNLQVRSQNGQLN